jgi:hypothetical protein
MDEGYSAEFDTVDATTWSDMLDRFDDASIYQTWSYDAVRHGEGRLSHFVLKSCGTIVSAGQLVVVKVPLLGTGVAYLRWGPLWRQRSSEPDVHVFRMALRALRHEYVLRRGLYLRIFPAVFDDSHAALRDVLSAERYVPSPGETPQRTLILDITPEEGELRRNFAQKWRNCLNKAERNHLEFSFGDDDAMFGQFVGIYRELIDRKGFREPSDINQFRRIQQSLPKRHRMGVFLSGEVSTASSGAICTAIGDTGVYVFGATNEQGMRTNGSYLIQWNVIRWLKENGCRYYNLNGVNPDTNPGTFHFKAGIAGRTGRDVRYLGRFDSYRGSLGAAGVFLLNRGLQYLRGLRLAFRTARRT